jgi:hypothetical protein
MDPYAALVTHKRGRLDVGLVQVPVYATSPHVWTTRVQPLDRSERD